MFRGRRSPDPDRRGTPDAAGEDPSDESSELSEPGRANWLNHLPDVRYPAMEDLLEDSAAESPPRERPGAGASTSPMWEPVRVTGRAGSGGNDELVAQAVAAFDAVQEAANAAITRIREAGRDAERSIEQVSGHRTGAIERRVSALGEELRDLGEQLAGTLRDAMLEFARELERRVSSYSAQLTSQHRDELQQLANTHTARVTEIGTELCHRLTIASHEATERVEHAGRETGHQLRSLVDRAAGRARFVVVGLAIVAVVAIVGLVLAARAGATMVRPTIVDRPAAETTVISTTLRASVPPPAGAVW